MAFLKSPKLSFILLQVSLYFMLLVPPATSLSFNFTGFNDSIRNGTIISQGDAQLSACSNIIDLTVNDQIKSSSNSMGRVLYNAPVQLWDNMTGNLTTSTFTTQFSFTIKSSSNACDENCTGDGLTFFLAPYGSVIKDYLGGGGLGLFNSTAENSTSANNPRIVAVEFDTYKNTWDPDSNHIGIDIYSIVSVKNISCDSSFWNWMRNNSSPWEASVVYDSSSQNLSVGLTCANKSFSCEKCSLNYNVDLRDYLPENVSVGFSASTGGSSELHQLNSWYFSSSLSPEIDDRSNDTVGGLMWGSAVGFIVGGAAIIAVLGLFLFFRQRRKSKADVDVGLHVPMGPREFSYARLVGATNNFTEKQKLGEGGFGGVYKGFLNDLKMDVAVKRISKGSKQGKKEYAPEVNVISRLQHKNLVKLVGWCHQQRKELLLVYEFMPNGSLDFHLFRNRGSLTWELRYKIALDLAFALQYLHEGSEPCVVHRDIKSSNIMLDSNFHAKLGDFGLARLVEHENNVAGLPVEHEKAGSQQTTIAGTWGYIAPEYVITGKASKEADVYSFGIVLLEIACGRKPIDRTADPSELILVEWVWELYGRGKHLEAADPSQAMDSKKKQVEYMIVVGLWCAQQDSNLRPSIRQAINVLKFDFPLPILPYKEPVSPPFNMSTLWNITSYGSAECDTNHTQCSFKSCTTDSANLNMPSTSSSSAASLLHNT